MTGTCTAWWDSPNVASIRSKTNGVTLKCIGANPKTAHGLAPVLILADEPAQWEKNKAAKMRAALIDAGGKIEGYRFIALGTRPDSSEHWFSKQLAGEADYVQVHAADPKDPPFQVRTWKKANPSPGSFPLAASIVPQAGGKCPDQSGWTWRRFAPCA